MDRSEYEAKVIDWIAEWSGKNRLNLSLDTSLNRGWRGFGIAGDDGVELIDFLRSVSGVSFSDFPVQEYFGSELSIAYAIFEPR